MTTQIDPISRSRTAPISAPYTPEIGKQLPPFSPSASSISPSSAAPYFRPSRPELSPPEERPASHPLLMLIRAHQKLEVLNQKQILFSDQEIGAAFEEMKRLSEEKSEELRKELAAAASQSSWGVLATLAQYLTATSSIVLGILCWSQGLSSGAAFMLVGSGAIGLTNQAMHDTGGWAKMASWLSKSAATQRLITERIEMGAFFLSLGFGLSGGFLAYHSGALTMAAQGTNANQMRETLATVLGTSGLVLGQTGKIGGAAAQKRHAFASARQQEIGAEITAKNQEITALTEETKNLLDTLTSLSKETAKAIEAAEITA